jgi:hypothetical protein
MNAKTKIKEAIAMVNKFAVNLLIYNSSLVTGLLKINSSAPLSLGLENDE